MRVMSQRRQTSSWRSLSATVTMGARCAYCGAEEDLVAHHKIPRRRFAGQDALENLEPVCRSCHPRIEQEAAAAAAEVWERPEPAPDERPARPRRRLKRPY